MGDGKTSRAVARAAALLLTGCFALAPPAAANEEAIRVYLMPIQVPGESPKGRHRSIQLVIMLEAPSEESAAAVCYKRPLYANAMLAVFHAKPVRANDRGRIADRGRLLKRLSNILRRALGTDQVANVQFANAFGTGRTRGKVVKCHR